MQPHGARRRRRRRLAIALVVAGIVMLLAPVIAGPIAQGVAWVAWAARSLPAVLAPVLTGPIAPGVAWVAWVARSLSAALVFAGVMVWYRADKVFDRGLESEEPSDPDARAVKSGAGPLWSDEPGSLSDIDGRAGFAQVVGGRIDACVIGQGSTVFGLVGPWGSGKSSLIKEIRTHLPGWTVVDFTPWSASDTASLTGEFLATLATAFPQSQTVKDSLAKYSRYGLPALGLIPAVGDAASKVAESLLTDFAARPPWHTQFGQISQAIASQDKRVLVVVDDVDRLDADELRALFRVVRLLGRFTNVHYLLAYDQSSIEKLLTESGSGGHSSEYTEKIVQYPFELPPVPKVARRRWAREIVEHLQDGPRDGPGRAVYADEKDKLVSILAMGLETPRAAQRLREQITSLEALVAGAEVDALDFIALTWIRVTHHRLWDHIRLHPETYLGWREDGDKEVEERRDRLLTSLIDHADFAPAQAAVRFIFTSPGLRGAFSGRQWRMCNARFFDRYFLIGVPGDDVSDLMIGRAVKALEANQPLDPDVVDLREILIADDEDRAALALESINRVRQSSFATSVKTLELIDGVLAHLEQRPQRNDGRRSGLDRWLNREIFLALETRLTTSADLISRYGYEQLTYSAYYVRRLLRQDPEEFWPVYQEVATTWLAEVERENVDSVVERPELIAMTSFLIWLTGREDLGGFLEEKITDGEAFLRVAMAFVGFSEWVGSSTTYEVTFREQEFRFAMGSALTSSLVADLPAPESLPDYETDDLPERSLSDLQRRDVALRSIAALKL